MINWFSAMVTVGLANLVVAWVEIERGDYNGTAFSVMAALLMFYLTWREIDE